MTGEYAIPSIPACNATPASEVFSDDERFAAFYQRNARPLWAYLAGVLGNSALADDLLQESFLRFLCTVRWQDGEVACRSYLYRIATNQMRDHWRRPTAASIEEVHESDLPIMSCDIEKQIDFHFMLRPVFAQMRPRERELLWLAYAEEATHREIAQITGLGTASIRLLLFRARRKMAHLLRQQKLTERSNP